MKFISLLSGMSRGGTRKRGFSLVELMVSVAIISVLSVVVWGQVDKARQSGRNTKRRGDLNQLTVALKMYSVTNRAYPSTSGEWWGNCSAFGSHGTSGANGWIPNLTPTYIPTLPLDPKNNQSNGGGSCANAANNCYAYRSDGTDYKLIANCTPEGSWTSSDQFYDSVRPTTAWQVSTPGGASW